MSPQHIVKTEVKGTLGIISLAGDFSGSSEDLVMNAYAYVSGAGATRILLRCMPGFYVNSAGIAVLIMMVSEARRKNQKVGAVGLSQHFQKIFEMIGLTDYVTLFQNEEAAIKGF